MAQIKRTRHCSSPSLFAALLFLAASASAQSLWQIGTFDQSPVEFAPKHTGPVHFQIGKSTAAADWPTHQTTGESYQVTFPLASVRAAYLLKIAALIDRPRVPALKIDINGHSGIFFLHPELSYSRSDFAYAFDPHESQSPLSIDMPAPFLKAGENTLTITCIDDPATQSGEEELGGISYDALSFEQTTAPSQTSASVKLSAEPTIFFHQTNGQTTEVVDVFARLLRPVKTLPLDLEIAGRHFKQTLAAGDFGEQRFSLDLPAWRNTIQAKLNAGYDQQAVELTAQRQWTIFVVPHTHLDIGFTDYQGKVAETQPRVLTQAGNLIQQHPDFRFSMDGSWNLEQLLDTRPKAKRQEILNLIRSGKMALPAQYCNLLTGYASTETLYRSLYKTKELSRQYHLPFEYANITDVPTYSGTYPSILASSGIKYWVAAANNDRAPIFYYDHWNEKSPFYWQGPDGKRVLFWYSRHYEQVQTLFGLSPQLPAVRESLPIYLQAYSKPSYKPDVALIYGTQVENTDLVPSTATFVDAWDKQYAFPKLTYATFPDFFHYMESHYASDLPTFKGDGGGYWEDGIGSDAYFEAEDRVNQNRALSAEVLSSVTHSLDPDLNPPSGAFTDIWRNIMLFAEHTWLSYNSVSQPEHDEAVKQLRVKDDRADRASLEIEDVVNRSLSQLADHIHIPAETLVVFNSLSWPRSPLVEVDLREHPALVDLTTNQQVPLQVISNKESFQRVRFLAKDVPAVGYKCFRIVYNEQTSPARPESSKSQTVENNFYRVTLDEGTGSLKSIFDKQLKKELVDQASPYKFGEYLYVTGGDGDTQMINPFPALPPGKLTVHGAERGAVAAIEKTPWGHSIHLSSTNLNTPAIDTEIILFNDAKKIAFRYHVHKNYTTAKEAVYFAFPVSAQHPSFHYASQQGWIDPARDLMKGGSLEWFNVQQWMSVGDEDVTVGIVPLDASLASFGDINRGRWPGIFHPSTATIFSYAMNNYWHTNYRAGQGGDFTFRYVLTSSARLDGGALSHLGLEAMRRPELNYVVSQDKVGDPPRPLPPAATGFLTMSNPNTALITWKQAEDGDGMILRLAELSGNPAASTLHFTHLSLASAHLCNGVEDNLKDLPVTQNTTTLSFQPFEVQTVRITTSAPSQ